MSRHTFASARGGSANITERLAAAATPNTATSASTGSDGKPNANVGPRDGDVYDVSEQTQLRTWFRHSSQHDAATNSSM